MEWWVIVYDPNSRKIESHNCLAGREETIKELRKKAGEDIETFKSLLKTEMMYYYWSKCEWEIIVSAWPPTIDREEEYKLDVWTQIYMNWDKFVDYCWTCKIPRKKNGIYRTSRQKPLRQYE